MTEQGHWVQPIAKLTALERVKPKTSSTTRPFKRRTILELKVLHEGKEYVKAVSAAKKKYSEGLGLSLMTIAGVKFFAARPWLIRQYHHVKQTKTIGMNSKSSTIKSTGLLIGATRSKFIMTSSIIQQDVRKMANTSTSLRALLPDSLSAIRMNV